MAAGYDGSIKIDTRVNEKGFNQGTKNINLGLSGLTRSVRAFGAAVGIAFGVLALVSFGKASLKAASELESAMIGLKSIVQGQGRSWKEANAFTQKYISDGLIPATQAATAYKNLAMRGYTDPQIEQTLIALKDSAAFGRQASLTLGQAVATATEGLKNENSILVDNSGVTKNVSMMWKDYAKSIGVGVQSLTKQQKIQAEVNGILEETRFQTGDATKVLNTYGGQIQQLGFNFNNLKVAVGNALMPIVQAVLPGLNLLISALTRIANLIAQVTTVLFGKVVKQQSGVKSSATGAAKAEDALAAATKGAGDASKKTSKDISKSLAGFDDLNVLADKTASSVGSVGDSMADAGAGSTDLGIGVEEVETGFVPDPKILKFIDDMKTALEPTTAAVGRLWEALKRVGGFVWQGLEDFYSLFLDPVGKWVLGEKGLPRFIDLVAGTLNEINWGNINSSLRRLWVELTGLATFTGNSLIDFYQFFLKPLAVWTMNEAVPRLINALTVGLAQVDWDNINGKLKELWMALEPFSETIGEGLLWLWENVLVPLIIWNLNVALPSFLGLLATAVETLDTLLIALKPTWDIFWNTTLLPLAEWAGGKFVETMDSINEDLEKFSNWIKENKGEVAEFGDLLISILAGIAGGLAALKITSFITSIGGISAILGVISSAITALLSPVTLVIAAITAFTAAIVYLWQTNEEFRNSIIEAFESIGSVLKNVWDTMLKPMFDIFMETIDLVWEKHIKPLVANFIEFVNQLVQYAAMIITKVLSPIINFLVTTFGPAFVSTFKTIVSIIGNAIGVISDVIGGFLKILSGLIEFIIGIFTGDWGKAWNGVVNVFKGLFDTIGGIVKGVVNTVIDLVNGMLQTVTVGLNWVIKGINSIGFDVPEGIPGIGGKSFRPNIKNITPYQIPKLATGAVIPPNSEFLAILGDQKSGTNVEAPLNTIEAAVERALSRHSFNNSQQSTPQTVTLEINGQRFARLIIPYIEGEKNRIGIRAVKGGGV